MGSFRTSARAVELLGRKQIRDSVTALAELMKNSYDADSEFLQVDFLTKTKPSVTLCDNGVGMDEDDITNKWLVLGTKSKKGKSKKITSKGRRVMGEKGIGRLAVASLGQQMWLISKKKNSGWNILYLNWNLFENPDLFIDDVIIPSEYNVSFVNFSSCFKHLEEMQLKNLDLDIWKSNSHIQTKKFLEEQVRNNQPNLRLINELCNRIDFEGNQGTIIYSNCLNDNWERYLDASITSKEDLLATQNRNRMHAFLAGLNNADEGFKAEVFLNGKSINLESNFDDSDFEIYDLKIEGKIEKGYFYGKIDARNADKMLLEEANNLLKNGLSVTAGINNWSEYDCGSFTVKFCHIEGEDKGLSSVTESERRIVESRMSVSGGIGVYRDGVRVLPYGEPRNDFLNLEERRNTRAGTYVFSHRNTFGRIDITSQNNPGLEDKSSREGLIENEKYYYFIKTMENLLIKIAKEILGTSGKDSPKLRDSYTQKNKSINQEKKRITEHEEKIKKAYQKKEIESKKKLNSGLNEYNKFVKKEKNILEDLPEITILSYDELLRNLSDLAELCSQAKDKANHFYHQWTIEIPKDIEHLYEDDFLEKIDKYNLELTRNITSYLNEISANEKKVRESIFREIEIKKNEVIEIDKICLQLNEKADQLTNSIYVDFEELKKNLFKNKKELDPVVTLLQEFINEKYSSGDNYVEKAEILANQKFNKTKKIKENIKKLRYSDKKEVNIIAKKLTEDILNIDSTWKKMCSQVKSDMEQVNESATKYLQSIF